MERAGVVCEGEKSRRSRQRWFSVARPLLLFTRLQVAVVLAMERGRTGRGGLQYRYSSLRQQQHWVAGG